MKRLLVVLFTVALLLASCSKESPTTPQETPDTTSGGVSRLADIYDQLPSPAGCSAGSLKSAERTSVVQYINAIRSRHGLGPVDYRASDDQSTATAALICVANHVLNHQPPSSYSCWSQAGADACSTSNLGFWGWAGQSQIPSSRAYVDMWLKDSLTESVGHRRWILNPFLRHISFGRVDQEQGSGSNLAGSSAAALKVINDDDLAQPANGTPQFIAYPFESYPAQLLNSGIDLTFSVLAYPGSYWDNQNVDLSHATVTMRRGGTGLGVTSLTSANDASGLPNMLRWRAAIVRGDRYDVHIGDVRFDGTSHAYDYWFQLQ